MSATDPESSPEVVFERQWALRVTECALERLRRDYADRGQERTFQELRPFLTSSGSPPNQAAGSSSSEAFRAALHRARRRFGEALRSEIRETVDESDVEDELRFLLRALMS